MVENGRERKKGRKVSVEEEKKMKKKMEALVVGVAVLVGVEEMMLEAVLEEQRL